MRFLEGDLCIRRLVTSGPNFHTMYESDSLTSQAYCIHTFLSLWVRERTRKWDYLIYDAISLAQGDRS